MRFRFVRSVIEWRGEWYLYEGTPRDISPQRTPWFFVKDLDKVLRSVLEKSA